MIRDRRLFCDECGWRLRTIYYSELEGELPVEEGGLDPRHAEQHLCRRCYGLIWKRTVGYHCHTDCRTQPCKRGDDCWVNPWPSIMYLCFVAKRQGAFHPNVGPGMALLEAL